MTSESCLICKNKCTNFKKFNQYEILICDDCSFSYIKTNNNKPDEVFSKSEKNFYDRSIIA